MGTKRTPTEDPDEALRLFEAEAAYAHGIFLLALGDVAGSVQASERSLAWKPDYPPAVLTMGSIEYQRGNEELGARLFETLITLPDDDGDLWEVLDRAGGFLIDERRYAEGLELYAAACLRFPDRVPLLQGLACCAGHEEAFDRSIEAARKALELEPARADLTSDLGWSLFQAGRLEEAEETLRRAIALDPDDERGRENLRICRAARAGDDHPLAGGDGADGEPDGERAEEVA
jgi:tetratricopeptide (TPR) repeat protein